MKNRVKIIASVLTMLFLTLILLIGCGDRKLITGVFLDSAVEGMTYETESTYGQTNETGDFVYRKNEQVSFYIGDLFIGSAKAAEELTPLDLVESATAVTNDQVTNIARLLQTLDQNSNPDDGILISQSVADSASNNINFAVIESQFEADAAVIALIESAHGLGTELVSASVAQEHLQNTINGLSSSTSVDVKAIAGSDEVVSSGNVVTLTGETEGDVTSFGWSQESGEVALIFGSSDPSSSLGPLQVQFTAPTVSTTQEYTFTFTVEAEDGSTDVDTLVVTVNPL